MFAQDAKYQRRTLGLTFVAPCGPGAKKFFKNPLDKFCILWYYYYRKKER